MEIFRKPRFMLEADVVFIVLVNGKVSEVYNNEEAAKHHAKMQNRKWSVTSVISREVKFL
jgi:hypothetical protein